MNINAYGVMFHHFHGSGHPKGQGSVTAEELGELIRFIRQDRHLLNAQEFHDLALENRLPPNASCLTFDDSLLCQYDIAAPVLAQERITAFFFVYSSAFSESPDMLEVYRYFRSTSYRDFDTFCVEFMQTARDAFQDKVERSLNGFEPNDYLVEYPFYSRNDRLFRYVRDRVLSTEDYGAVMTQLMQNRGFNVAAALPKLFMRPDHVVKLHDQGHVIGLHSHSHPLEMSALNVDAQRMEYATNFAFLENLLGTPPRTMSHPMGRYSDTTIEVLSDMGISLGFRANMKQMSDRGLLEIPREDHANIMKGIRREGNGLYE